MSEGQRVLILEARFYEDIADQLVAGAMDALDEASVGHERISVPGAFELPAALAMAIDSERFDGFVALGCVIRGETSHYEHVCGESARGLAMLAERHRIALGFGVVTAENREQAWETGGARPAQQGRRRRQGVPRNDGDPRFSRRPGAELGRMTAAPDIAQAGPHSSPGSWSARRCPADRVGEARSAMWCIGQPLRRTLSAGERRPSGRAQAPARGVAGLNRSPRYAFRPVPGGSNAWARRRP